MTDFLERLPWRLAALAGLLVGAASLIAGTDSWIILVRVGAAFLIFGGLGLTLRVLMRGNTTAPGKQKHPPPVTKENEPGSHVDQTTPEMTVDDL